jgi:hypothetical protein
MAFSAIDDYQIEIHFRPYTVAFAVDVIGGGFFGHFNQA